jgi:hypothetical protein
MKYQIVWVSGNIKKGLSNLLKSNYLEFTIPEKQKSEISNYPKRG